MSRFIPPWPPERIRDQYEESTIDGITIGTISDPENDDAWIESSFVQPVEA